MNYRCSKCQNDTYELEHFTNISKELSRIFNQQNKKFIAISCTECGYTEFYKVKMDFKHGDKYTNEVSP